MFRTIVHKIRVLRARRHEKKKEQERSPHWSTFRDKYLKEHPNCEACGGNMEVQVHHEEPFHKKPERELDPKNVLGLCMGRHDCHLLIGHGGSFRAWNPRVREHAKLVAINPKIRADIEKQAKAVRRM